MDRRKKEWRITGYALGVLAAALVLLGELFNLQIGQHNSFLAAADANAVRGLSLPAPRGLIVTSNGTILAGNRPSFAATYFDFGAVPSKKEAQSLESMLGVTAAQMVQVDHNILVTPAQPAIVKSNLTPAEVTLVDENLAALPGVSVLPLAARYYPQGTLTSAMVGYVTPSGTTAGLEKQYNKYLTGTAGLEEVEVNAAGQPVKTLNTVAPKRGDTLVLGINNKLQHIAYASLMATIANLKKTFHQPARAGSVMVMNIHTGQILALVSYPSYNPYLFVNGMTQAQYNALVNPAAGAAPPLINYATQVQLPPGSTFKMAVAVAALEAHKITPKTEFYGYAVFPDPPYPHNWTYPYSTGWNNLSKAISESTDTFFYEVGKITGITTMMHWAAQLGFGKPTGIDLPYEYTGFLPSLSWYDSVYKYFAPAVNFSLAIGQGATEVTPVQLLQYTAAIANNGVGYTPHLAEKILSPSGKLIWTYRPKRSIDVKLPQADWNAIHQGMHGVTLPTSPWDTAEQEFLNFPMAVAGKTGTAQIPGSTSTYDTWFVSYAPLKNPQIAVVVFVDHGEEGANTAYVARDIYDAYFHLKDPSNPMPVPGLPGYQSKTPSKP